ncbi:MAG: hypothetical protein LBI62_03165 [Candidatus Accumulibacter sp.]|nr:hypothetical protein [Accumulibacter sp.]
MASLERIGPSPRIPHSNFDAARYGVFNHSGARSTEKSGLYYRDQGSGIRDQIKQRPWSLLEGKYQGAEVRARGGEAGAFSEVPKGMRET